LEDIGAIAEPEKERHGVAMLQELSVGAEEFGEEALQEGVVLAEENLGAELKRPVSQERVWR
jgi:hypothetical protein